MTHGTPRDYSQAVYQVYFEVGEWQETAFKVLASFVGPEASGSIQRLEFGYVLALPIQSIPEVVRQFCQHNIAVYQIVRGEQITLTEA
ncbi:hypothetical protein [Vibrio europaeus]|uniref:hypothetical protein n=1 Tax=Vibrio europaeus TaxID=300876 RepID=UPI00233EE597|nr:hypothetical protein [Vibrio europaeus]MDC5853789.1 hypothetical protein [Vibrio europaeus]